MMPDADRMLSALRDAGLRRILVTGSGQGSLLDEINRDYPGIFLEGDRITAYDVSHGKPHPEPYLKGLERASMKPWEAIVVENAPLGVQAGHDAGCFTIAVATGPIPQEELYKAGADLVFSSMAEWADMVPTVLGYIKKIDMIFESATLEDALVKASSLLSDGERLFILADEIFRNQIDCDAGRECYFIEAGESNKNLDTLQRVWRFFVRTWRYTQVAFGCV